MCVIVLRCPNWRWRTSGSIVEMSKNACFVPVNFYGFCFGFFRVLANGPYSWIAVKDLKATVMVVSVTITLSVDVALSFSFPVSTAIMVTKEGGFSSSSFFVFFSLLDHGKQGRLILLFLLC